MKFYKYIVGIATSILIEYQLSEIFKHDNNTDHTFLSQIIIKNNASVTPDNHENMS